MSVNKVFLLGNVGNDPEIRSTQQGMQVASISLATTEKWKDKQTGQMQEKTEWHRLSAFGKTAEIAGQYIRKGSKIFVEGSIETRKWQDQQGQDRYTTQINVLRLQLLDSQPQSGAPRQAHQGQHNGGNTPQAGFNHMGHAVPGPTFQRPSPQPQQQQMSQPPFDDDIPF